MKHTTYAELSEVQCALLQSAQDAMKRSYNPYSHVAVGSALRTITGEIFQGTNVENAAWDSVCAERGAIQIANLAGSRSYSSIAIIAKTDERALDMPIVPCGRCRQMLYEFSELADVDTEVIMSNSMMDQVIIASISELLPQAFGPKDFGLDIKQYVS